jgi:tRNA A37 threonylcarbamoyladenosine modification protein TsaB
MVATLGFALLKKGEHLNLSTFSPLYIRPSEAEMKWQEAHSD